MKKKGIVSLWFGIFNSSDDFERYLKFEFNEDGDILPSNFMRDFNIDYYDDDFKESEYYNQSLRNIKEILTDFSYDDIIIPKFITILGRELSIEINAVLALFNFQYNGEPRISKNKNNKIQFIGSIEYE